MNRFVRAEPGFIRVCSRVTDGWDSTIGFTRVCSRIVLAEWYGGFIRVCSQDTVAQASAPVRQ